MTSVQYSALWQSYGTMCLGGGKINAHSKVAVCINQDAFIRTKNPGSMGLNNKETYCLQD